MVALVHGFPSKFRALQFEWVWQHPLVSKLTRDQLAYTRGSKGLGTPRSVKRKVLEMLEMVNLEPWKSLNLTVTFTSHEMHQVARVLGEKYHATRCDTRALETFQGVEKETLKTSTYDCSVCENSLKTSKGEARDKVLGCYYDECEMYCHSTCLMDHFQSMRESEEAKDENEMSGECPQCQQFLTWTLLMQHLGEEKENKKRQRRGKKRDRVDNKQTEESEEMTFGGFDEKATSEEKKNTQRDEEMDVLSVVSSSSTRSFAVEYNSDGWFEDDNAAKEVIWKVPTSQHLLSIQQPKPSNESVEMIDLTDE